MKNPLDDMSEEEIDALFEQEFNSFMDKPFKCKSPNRESRQRYLRTSMKCEPIRYQ